MLEDFLAHCRAVHWQIKHAKTALKAEAGKIISRFSREGKPKFYLTGRGGGELLWQLGESGGTFEKKRRGEANYESSTETDSWSTGGRFWCAWHQRRLMGNGTWRRSCRSLTGLPRVVWFWSRDWQWHHRKSPHGESRGHRWKTLEKKGRGVNIPQWVRNTFNWWNISGMKVRRRWRELNVPFKSDFIQFNVGKLKPSCDSSMVVCADKKMSQHNLLAKIILHTLSSQ